MTGILPDIICISSVTVQNTRIMKCDRETFMDRLYDAQ